MTAGAVLCGGASRRMGTDKAALVHDGERLVDRAARRLEAGGFAPVVVAPGRAGRLGPLGWREVDDVLANAGPLSGLVAALTAVAADQLVAVVAVDMVAFDTELLSALAAARVDEDAIVPLDLDGRAQPLHAVYAAAAAPSLRAALDAGHRAVRDALAQLNVRYVITDGADPRWSRNLNTPDDLVS